MYQLIVVAANVISMHFEANKKPGDVVWVRSFDAARQLIEGGICKWPAPLETKPAGPQFTKPAEPSQKKSSGERTAGPSTVSPSSHQQHGPAKLSSASAAALLPPQRV